MVVYWDLAAALSALVDYLLLLGTARLAGRTLPRIRLLSAAAFGGVFATVQLFLQQGTAAVAAAFILMAALAFCGTGRALKLSLLFLALSCALAGGVVLLGTAMGHMESLANGLIYARIPWGIFFTASILSYLLLTFVFRGGARHMGEKLVRVTFMHSGRSITLTLLCDSGNLLRDEKTGLGVPVVNEAAINAVLKTDGKDITLLPCTTVGGSFGSLRAFRCDAVTCDGTVLGSRLVALTPQQFEGGFQGLWFAEEREGTNAKAFA